MEYGMNEITNRYIFFYYMRNIEKNIENRMMEWRDESNGMEDDERMAKIRKLGNQSIW